MWLCMHTPSESRILYHYHVFDVFRFNLTLFVYHGSQYTVDSLVNVDLQTYFWMECVYALFNHVSTIDYRTITQHIISHLHLCACQGSFQTSPFLTTWTMVSSPDVSLQHFNAGCQYTFPPQWAIKKIGDNNSNTKIEKKMETSKYVFIQNLLETLCYVFGQLMISVSVVTG